MSICVSLMKSNLMKVEFGDLRKIGLDSCMISTSLFNSRNFQYGVSL